MPAVSVITPKYYNCAEYIGNALPSTLFSDPEFITKKKTDIAWCA